MSLSIKNVLVVDDDSINRKLLNKFLLKLHYEVFECENGEVAVQTFQENNIDLVLMDVMMPVMNGIDATKQIKQLSEHDFIPVLFLTALTTDDEMQECIEAGGDDFLSKPINLKVLESKILAFERIHHIYRETKQAKDNLKRDQAITKKIFHEAITSKNAEIPTLQSWFHSHQNINEELFLAARTPSNGINLLLGRMSVSGLAAAVGALPTTEVFRTMTEKGFAPGDILATINSKLHKLLPGGIYLSAIIININENLNQALCCNCGMPDLYQLSDNENKILNKVSMNPIKLGVEAKIDATDLVHHLTISEQQTLIFSSLFEDELISSSLNQTSTQVLDSNMLEQIKAQIKPQLDNELVNENFALFQLSIDESMIPSDTEVLQEISEKALSNTTPVLINAQESIEMEFKLQGKKLGTVDPVPIIINYLESVSDISSHREALFTILTELYVNALDHGVLGLKSSLKKSADGFAQYFELRTEKLKTISEGFVSISLNLNTGELLNSLDIAIKDSGPGFDFNNIVDFNPDEAMFSGRGIALVKGLCEKFEVFSPGNESVATYCWSND